MRRCRFCSNFGVQGFDLGGWGNPIEGHSPPSLDPEPTLPEMFPFYTPQNTLIVAPDAPLLPPRLTPQS